METGFKGNLTSEQIQQLKSHGIVENEPQSNPPPQNVPHQQNNVVQKKPNPLRVTKRVEKPIEKREVVEQGCSDDFYEDSGTYLRLEEKGFGSIEFDLISFREKGREERYLNIIVDGVDAEDFTSSKAILNIGSKQSFENLKKFISNLNWED